MYREKEKEREERESLSEPKTWSCLCVDFTIIKKNTYIYIY